MNIPHTDTPKPCATQTMINAAKALGLKMIACEKDPDLVSVFAIAQAHGYKPTSQLWAAELKAFVEAFNAYEAEKAASKEKPLTAQAVDPSTTPPPTA